VAEFNQSEPQNYVRKGTRLLIGISIFAFVLGLLQGIYGISYHGQAAAVAWSLPTIGVSGILFALWIIITWAVKPHKMTIHQNGFILWDSGEINHALRWNEVSGISFLQEEWVLFRTRIISTMSYVFPNRGRKINLGKYCSSKDLPEVVTRIKAALYPTLDPQLRKILWTKRAIYFGELSLSPVGLSFRETQYPWSEIKKIDINNGFLAISSNQSIFSISLKNVPNIELFLLMAELAKEIGSIDSRYAAR
jgi:hypothetical protein